MRIAIVTPHVNNPWSLIQARSFHKFCNMADLAFYICDNSGRGIVAKNYAWLPSERLRIYEGRRTHAESLNYAVDRVEEDVVVILDQDAFVVSDQFPFVIEKLFNQYDIFGCHYPKHIRPAVVHPSFMGLNLNKFKAKGLPLDFSLNPNLVDQSFRQKYALDVGYGISFQSRQAGFRFGYAQEDPVAELVALIDTFPELAHRWPELYTSTLQWIVFHAWYSAEPLRSLADKLDPDELYRYFEGMFNSQFMRGLGLIEDIRVSRSLFFPKIPISAHLKVATNNDWPRVSVITPSYNSSAFIEQTILSVQEQDYPDLEHIIVDGGSTDGTVDILKRFSDKVRWVSEPDRGQSEALNKGIGMAHGEIIGWLNADDVYLPHAVRTAVECLQGMPEAGMVYSGCYVINEVGERVDIIPLREFDISELVQGNYIPQPTAFLRRGVLEKIGPVNHELHFAMDYDLWLRVAKDFQIIGMPDIWACFRKSSKSKTIAHAEEFWPEVFQILNRIQGEAFPVSKNYFQEASRRAYLNAGLDSQYAGNQEKAKEFYAQAFSNDASPYGGISMLGERLIYQWHKLESAGDQSLEDVMQEFLSNLPNDPLRHEMAGSLYTILAFQAHQKGNRSNTWSNGCKALLSSQTAWKNRGLIKITFRAGLGI